MGCTRWFIPPFRPYYLQTLTAEMTAAEIITAQARAQEWVREHPREPEQEDWKRVEYDP